MDPPHISWTRAPLRTMWRSFFTAVGVCLAVLGTEALVLDRVVLKSKDKSPVQNSMAFATVKAREIIPPDWAPWSLLSSGAVTMLYSTTLRKGDGK